MIQDSRKKNKGFTLVEMIVSLALFSVVATVSLGALIKIVSANKKAQTLHATITNLNFALETMSREMRVGTKYDCYDFSDPVGPELRNPPYSCTLVNNQQIAFESSRELPYGATTCHPIIAYRFVNAGSGAGTIEKAEQESCGEVLYDEQFVPLISLEDVTITDVRLSVTPDDYPLAFIKISGTAGQREREKTDFTVQTAISARLP
jgi:prepilin-type N-terminal cleavage/methylation domain-containing protein